MRPLAADVLEGPGDTWGVPGPLFLILFTVAALALAGITLAQRRGGGGDAGHSRDLDPYEVAYLAGDRGRAVAAVLSVLRARQAVEPAGRGRLRVTSATRQRTAGSELDEAVHDTIRLGKEVKVTELTHQPKVAGVLDGMQARLEKEGLLVDADQRLWQRLPALALGLLGGLGVLRIVAGLQNDKPVVLLIVLTAVTLIGCVVLAVTVPRVSRAGKRALEAVQRRHAHLDPINQPAWATYGAMEVGLGVAIFGSAALTSFDPTFAEEAELHRQANTAGSSAGGCGGGGGDGGGCGGGGCGGCGG